MKTLSSDVRNSYPQLFSHKIAIDVINNICMLVFSHNQDFIDDEFLKSKKEQIELNPQFHILDSE